MSSRSPLLPSYPREYSVLVDVEKLVVEHISASRSVLPFPPVLVDNLLCRFHQERKARWSYGGYLEHRVTFLSGSYLDDESSYLHLGVDCNVPVGTVVVAPVDATVIDIFTDGDIPHGWGTRVILDPTKPLQGGIKIILGHLDSPVFKVGDVITAGEPLATIGGPPLNGNWWPHLHLQCISAERYKVAVAEGLDLLDGYGSIAKRDSLMIEFPDPTWLIF